MTSGRIAALHVLRQSENPPMRRGIFDRADAISGLPLAARQAEVCSAIDVKLVHVEGCKELTREVHEMPSGP